MNQTLVQIQGKNGDQNKCFKLKEFFFLFLQNNVYIFIVFRTVSKRSDRGLDEGAPNPLKSKKLTEQFPLDQHVRGGWVGGDK